jgi:hypothetical protein
VSAAFCAQGGVSGAAEARVSLRRNHCVLREHEETKTGGGQFSVSIGTMERQQKWKAFCAIALLYAPICAASQDAMQIPATHGTTLAGSEVALPDALKGKANIVVVGFSRASQEQIGNWGRLIAADYGKSPEITYYELALLGGAPKMLRAMIIKRMGSAVPFDERGHFIPVVEGEPAWRAVAHFNKSDDAYVLLVDSKGAVLWQAEGEATDAVYGTLKQQVAKSAKGADRH